jgi:membrane protein YqaA with SNARE-associated domain
MFKIFVKGKKILVRHSKKWWFAPAVGLLSALDAYLVILPNEPILMAATTAQPKRWLSLGLWATLGSALGAASVAWLVSLGSGWILTLFHAEKLMHSHAWAASVKAIDEYGLWGLAAVSLSPLPQHAAVIVAGFAGMSVWKVFLGVLIGRLPKYLGFSYLAAKSPAKLKKWHLLPKSA